MNKCFGYDVVDGQYCINEAEATTIRLMYDLTLEGKTTEEIAKYLNSKHILRNSTKSATWTMHSVYKTLSNVVYAGDFIIHSSEDDGCNYLPDHHVPIVSRGKWNAAQFVLMAPQSATCSGYYPMRIIKEGPLKGFIPIEYTWFGREAEDYIEACESIMNGREFLFDLGNVQLPVWEPGWKTALKEKHSSRHEMVTGNCQFSNKIAVGFTNHGIRYYEKCNLPDAFEMIIHPVDKIMAVKPCEYGIVHTGNRFRQTYAMNLIYQLMGWKRDEMHTVLGQKLGGVLFFDLTGDMRIPQSMVNGFSAEELEKYEPVCIEKDFWSRPAITFPSAVAVGEKTGVEAVRPGVAAMVPAAFLKAEAPDWAKSAFANLYLPKVEPKPQQKLQLKTLRR